MLHGEAKDMALKIMNAAKGHIMSGLGELMMTDAVVASEASTLLMPVTHHNSHRGCHLHSMAADSIHSRTSVSNSTAAVLVKQCEPAANNWSYLSMRSSRGPVTFSGRMGTTIRLGHTIKSARVSRRKGSSHRRTAFAVYPLPRALPKSSLNLI